MITPAPGSVLSRPAPWFNRNIYWILAAAVFAAEIIRVWQGHWIGDFWEHAAVVHELSRYPFDPRHPILNLKASHGFYSPYSLLVALFSRASGLSAIHSLECFALVNLSLYLLSFRFFCVSLFGKHKESLYALALLFSLFFWGTSPEQWSGFHHFYGLHFVLPYPSAFALSLSLFVTGLLLRKINAVNVAVTTLISSIVIIVHPNTALFLFTCITTVTMLWYRSGWQTVLPATGIMACAFLLALGWPYYHLWTLLTGDNSLFHEQSKELYDLVPAKYWPILLAILAAIIQPDRIKRFLAGTIGVTVAVYVYGYFSENYGLGRIIASSMWLTHILLAYHCVKTFDLRSRKIRAYSLTPVAIAFFACLLVNRETTQPGLFDQKHDRYYTRFYFLKRYVGADNLVLADDNATWFIPAISGKVVSWPHPLHFIADEKVRRGHVKAFFDQKATSSERMLILERYDPDFVLLDLKNAGPLSEWVKQYGTVVYGGDGLELISMDGAGQP